MTPTCILGPTMHFGVQNAILGPKCISGTKMFPGKKGARCPRTFLHRCSKIRRVKKANFVENLKTFQNFALAKVFFTEFPLFAKIYIKLTPFCILHQTLLKQGSDGAISGPNRQKCTFCSKITFWAQKCILGPKCTFCAKSGFWAKSAIWSKKCPLELSRTHIPPAQIASGRGRTPKSGFLLQKALFCSKTHFGRKSALSAPKCTFCGKRHFCVPMPRMLIKPMEF